MKFFKKYQITVILFAFTFLLSIILSACGVNSSSSSRFVYEDFKITQNVNDGVEIYGELIKGTGEGIFLDHTMYKDYEKVKDLQPGDKIRVTYNKDDYENDVWDNIINVEITD